MMTTPAAPLLKETKAQKTERLSSPGIHGKPLMTSASLHRMAAIRFLGFGPSTPAGGASTRRAMASALPEARTGEGKATEFFMLRIALA